MKTNDKYIITITILAAIVIILFMVIIIGIRIIDDLNAVIDMHKNTIEVCNMDLEQVQEENESLRERAMIE